VVLVAFAAILAGRFCAGGLILTGEALMPKVDKFNPAKNIKRIFGLDSVVNPRQISGEIDISREVAYGVLAPVIETLRHWSTHLCRASLPDSVKRFTHWHSGAA